MKQTDTFLPDDFPTRGQFLRVLRQSFRVSFMRRTLRYVNDWRVVRGPITGPGVCAGRGYHQEFSDG